MDWITCAGHCTACAAIWDEPTSSASLSEMAMLCRISRNSLMNWRSTKKIWFVGWVSDLDVYFRYLSTADICVAPEPSNHYNDNSTFVKIMEYMLAGKPIVAFDLPESRFSAEGAASYASPNNYQDFAAKLAALMDDQAYASLHGRTRPAANRNHVGMAALRSRPCWRPMIVFRGLTVSGRSRRSGAEPRRHYASYDLAWPTNAIECVETEQFVCP